MSSAINTVPTERGDKDKGDEYWASVLPSNQFKVLRRKATEPRSIGISKGGFDDHYDAGIYICAACKTPIYTSAMKFDCGCGWPGFYTNIKDNVAENTDKDGRRTEITCASCRSHLGHVFRGERHGNPPPDERHCVNSLSMAFIPEGSDKETACTYSGPVH